MSEVIKRLRQWYEIQMVRPVAESPDMTGGRDGELALQQLVGSSFPFNDANVFAGRRIPSKRQGRRREIDLIVYTPTMIHLIEVKNWSGRLDIRNGAWLQTRRRGEVVNHGNLLEKSWCQLGSISLGNDWTPISPADTVIFHAVGEEKPTSRRMVELDRILLG